MLPFLLENLTIIMNADMIPMYSFGKGGKIMTGALRVQRILISSVLLLCMLVLGALAFSHLFETSYLHAGALPESVMLVRDALLPNLAMTAGGIALLMALYRVLAKRRSGYVLAALCAMGAAGSAWFLFGANTAQIYDFQYVIEAAQLFARGNYKSLQVDYFHVYSYQLGFCLPMEILLRLIPSLNINRFMQVMNVVFSFASVGLMSVLAAEATGKGQIGRMTAAMSLLFLPLFFFPVFVYGTVPMVFFSLAAMLCFSRYLRTRRVGYGLLWPALMAIAYVLKPNAAVPMIAIGICAVLDALESRDYKILFFAGLSAALSMAAIRLAIMQYEIRGGVKLTEDMSALARLVMGLKDGGGAAGWYNSYTDKFLPLSVTAEMEREMAMADLREVVKAFAADPGSLACFLREKLLTQWLEPTNGCLWYGNLNDQHGPLAQLAAPVYGQDSALRRLLEGYMNVFQQGLYLLACVGMGKLLREKKNGGSLALALVFIGGVAYHLIFEAKSSYSYMYVLLLLPLAAQGLYVLEAWLSKAIKKIRK